MNCINFVIYAFFKSTISSIALIVIGAICLSFPGPVISPLGTSLITSGIVLFVSSFLENYGKYDPSTYGLTKIYEARQNLCQRSGAILDSAHSKIDFVCFGLTSFRLDWGNHVLTALNRGVNIRILTMHPDSQYIAQRAKEEQELPDTLKNQINELIAWAEDLNKKSEKGKISIKGYDTMTLDYYWRVDSKIYCGPYWINKKSGSLVTYEITEKRKRDLFSQYLNHFEELWSLDSEWVKELV